MAESAARICLLQRGAVTSISDQVRTTGSVPLLSPPVH